MSVLLEDYTQSYHDFIIAVRQIAAIYAVSKAALHDFPENLPQELIDPYNEVLSKIAETARTSGERATQIQWQVEDASDPVISLVFMVFAHVGAGRAGKIDFDRVISSQQLVMTFAHLDAFLGDTVRTSCRARPKAMKSKKTPTWDRALNADNWEQFVESMIDEYVYEFGWQNAAKRIELLKERFGIGLNVSPDEILFLDKAENLRHEFVHNGGKATQQYLDKANDSSLKLGELIPLDGNFLFDLSRLAINVVSELFASVLKQFFSTTPEDQQTMIWRTGIYRTVVTDD